MSHFVHFRPRFLQSVANFVQRNKKLGYNGSTLNRLGDDHEKPRNDLDV